MTIWTVVPPESLYAAAAPRESQRRAAVCDGVLLEVAQTSATQCEIVRILSTDPADFLTPELQPGAQLAFEA